MKMSEKIDLAMWTLNGKKTLAPVLERIEQVIPTKIVGQRFIVDDGSTDDTVKTAESHGWTVLRNEGKGISDGANTALKHVETEFFCSFEQDMLLSPDWWKKVSRHLHKPKVAAVSGMRFYPRTNPISCVELNTYLNEKKVNGENPLSLRAAKGQIGVGRTIDNTVYNTSVLRQLGGFPKLSEAGIDTVLAWVIKTSGFDWLVDTSVHSLHLRPSVRDALTHQFMYAAAFKETYSVAEELTGVSFEETCQTSTLLRRLATSPFIGLKLALRFREPKLAVLYPPFMTYFFNGFIRGSQRAD